MGHGAHVLHMPEDCHDSWLRHENIKGNVKKTAIVRVVFVIADFCAAGVNSHSRPIHSTVNQMGTLQSLLSPR